jgi:hypothetical protein
MKTNSLQTIRALSAFVIVALILSSPARAQLIFGDTFDVTGGNSTTTGFGTDGVNQELNGRLSGTVFTANPGMQLLPLGGKAGTAYSIVNNAMNVADAAGVGSIQYSADGATTFNFGSFLEGTSYEIRLTMSLADAATGSVRTSFYIADASAPTGGVGGANLGFQIATNATAMGTESIFRRLSAASSPTAAAINGSISSGYAFGEPIDFRLVINDSSDYTPGVYASSYELFANDVSVNSGTLRFNNSNRFIVFDTAPNSGPATYDNFQIVPEPSSSLLALAGGSVLGMLRRSRQSGRR